MKLKDLLHGINFSCQRSQILDQEVLDVTCRSQDVIAGSIFVAIKGEVQDGHAYVDETLRNGALACLVERGRRSSFSVSAPLIEVSNTRRVFSLLTARFFQHPSQDVRVIGITGTNGKTTVSYLVQHLANRFSTCGLIGTIQYKIGSQRVDPINTTPSAHDLNRLLHLMRMLRIRYCCMEISSHALEQDRVTHLHFHSAVFTNLTQDHLDYHKDLESYFQAKKKLFTKTPAPEKSYVNADDPYGRRLLEEVAPRPLSFAVGRPADFLAQNIRVGLEGIAFDLKVRGNVCPVRVRIPCLHNVYNILAALACAHGEGWDPQEMAESLRRFPGVPGRMERVDCGQDFFVFVDYAHTPDAFRNVLSSVRATMAKRLITVFGCGGDRDKTKRPLMGRIACKYSDGVVLTSDNPRSEDPEKILDDIETGVVVGASKQVIRISNREEAIAQGLDMAQAGDVVLILGKGHERYQIVGNEKFAFVDRDCVEKILSARAHV